MIHGTLPDCIHSSLDLEWLWIDDNRIHGPVSEFSPLGQYLKNVEKLNLAANRWAPLLPSEKDALSQISEPLGVTERDHDWDFGHHYEWHDAPPTAGDQQLTAERQVSYRYWGAGVPAQGFAVGMPFGTSGMPHRGGFATQVGVGPEADYALGSESDFLMEWNPELQSGSMSGWGSNSYQGCYADLCYFASSGCGDYVDHPGELSFWFADHSIFSVKSGLPG